LLSPWPKGPHSIGLANGARSRRHQFQGSSTQLRSGPFEKLMVEQLVESIGGDIVAVGSTALQSGVAVDQEF
jgi:hypothetical protein